MTASTLRSSADHFRSGMAVIYHCNNGNHLISAIENAQWLTAMSALTLIRKAPNAASVYLLLTAYLESAGARLSDARIDAAVFNLPVRNVTEIAVRRHRMIRCLQDAELNPAQTRILREACEMIEAAGARLRALNCAPEPDVAVAGAVRTVADSVPGAISPPQRHGQDR